MKICKHANDDVYEHNTIPSFYKSLFFAKHREKQILCFRHYTPHYLEAFIQNVGLSIFLE